MGPGRRKERCEAEDTEHGGSDEHRGHGVTDSGVHHRSKRRADHRPAGDGRANDGTECVAERCEADRATKRRIRGLAEPDRPDDRDNRQRDSCGKHRTPRADRQDRLPHERHHDRADQEHRHEDRHDAGHSIACREVAGDGEAQHRWPRRTESPDEAADQQQLQARGSGTRRRGERVEHQAADEDRAATEPVCQHATDELPHGHAGEVRGSGDGRTDAASVEVEVCS